MTIQSDLLVEIEDYIRGAGISETAFGKKAINDGKLVSRLRSKENMTLRTLEKIREFLDQNSGCPFGAGQDQAPPQAAE